MTEKQLGSNAPPGLKSCHNLTHVSNLQSLKRRRITLFSENIILQIILSKVIQCTASLRCNVVRKTGPNTTRCLGYLDTVFCRFRNIIEDRPHWHTIITLTNVNRDLEANTCKQIFGSV
jgi:hypothetical protein